MSHRSDLPSDWTNGMLAFGDDQEMFEPGSASSYSNPGFVLFEQIVAEVSGQPFIEYVKEHILAPLGMVNTDFTYSNQAMIAKAAAPAIPGADFEDVITEVDQAKGFITGADLIREVDDRYAWMNRFNVLAANGGLIGPVTEAMRFAQMHLNGAGWMGCESCHRNRRP